MCRGHGVGSCVMGFAFRSAIMQCVTSASVLRQQPQANFWSCMMHIFGSDVVDMVRS